MGKKFKLKRLLRLNYKIKRIVRLYNPFVGADGVVIYNFLALLTIDTNINQFIYRLSNYFIKIKQFYKKTFANICSFSIALL